MSQAAQQPTRKRYGFTLIELSIALVIIGLIVGAVLVGRDLVKAAQLQKAGSTANQIVAKVRLFKDMYAQLPGNTDKAWSLWGTECASTKLLCNGAPNGLIQSSYYRVSHGYGNPVEDQCVFRHLALAGLWEGETSAAACSTGVITIATLASNPELLPKAIDTTRFQVGGWDLYGLHNANAVSISQLEPSGMYMNYGGLSNADARALDTKFDDGQPASGQVFVSPARGQGGCLNVQYYDPAPTITWYSSYSTAGKACQVHFWID